MLPPANKVADHKMEEGDIDALVGREGSRIRFQVVEVCGNSNRGTTLARRQTL